MDSESGSPSTNDAATKRAIEVWQQFASEDDPKASLARAVREEIARLAIVPHASDSLRSDYEAAVRAIEVEVDERKKRGDNLRSIAVWANAERRRIGAVYKDLTPEPLYGYILARCLLKYEDPLGPTVPWLLSKGKTYAQIIKKASEPGGFDLGFGKT